ncbi:ATP-binding cassette domain-containing protein, partial [Nonomuraea sp. NPDC049784]|uniref:ATP-binding cassette domain-containing protein n=1 Tax=Nonomuraea sp. NPDC049784 TaxID=3154361 RepID=UPI0033E86035
MNVLEIRDLSVDYLSGSGAVHAVADVSLDLRRGEILGLAGESGSGKSTLANAVARLLRPPAAITSGSVVYRRQDGSSVDVLGLRKRELRAFRWKELAVVFQSAMNSLNPVSTVGAQIDDVLRIHTPETSRKDRAERAVELLQRVGISSDRRRSYPHELSGGMRQRAAI